MNRREFIDSTVACGAVARTPACPAVESKGGLKMPVKVKKGKVAVVHFARTGNTRFAAQKNDEVIMRSLQEKLRVRIASGDPCGPFYAAVVAADGAIVAEAANSVVPERCSHNHAEMNAIRAAEAKLGTWNLAKRGLALYTTAEPCMMCVGGILWSGIERVVYGVGTEAVERITGFDEGFKPRWREEFAARGIAVTGPVLSELGEEVLNLYVSRQGVVYSPRAMCKASWDLS